MAAKCPKCGGDLSGAADNTCPACGANVSQNSKPSYEKIKTASTAVMVVGCVLVFLDFFGVLKTYIGTLILGIGFLISFFYLRQKGRVTGSSDKKAMILTLIIGLFITIAGIVFIYLDMTL